MSSVRPIWLTQVQRDQLLIAQHNLPTTAGGFLGALIAAWDAAPADATEAAHAAIRELLSVGAAGAPQRLVVAAVLAALGMPEASPTETEPHEH